MPRFAKVELNEIQQRNQQTMSIAEWIFYQCSVISKTLGVMYTAHTEHSHARQKQ